RRRGEATATRSVGARRADDRACSARRRGEATATRKLVQRSPSANGQKLAVPGAGARPLQLQESALGCHALIPCSARRRGEATATYLLNGARFRSESTCSARRRGEATATGRDTAHSE